MTIQEAIRQRHMVRKYLDKPIPEELAAGLRERLEMNNRVSGLHLTLVTGSADGLGAVAKLISKHVNNYIILAGPDTPDLDEALGYWGADAMLFAQTLGLNSWWIGGMFNAKGAAGHLTETGLRVNGVLAVGYGASQGIPHKSKTASDISSYNGSAPRWFQEGAACPLCQRAEKMLREAGIGYRKILAEEEPELAKKYSIRQAPTLIIGEGTQGDMLLGIAAIKQFPCLATHPF